MVLASDVVAAARGYLGVPFRHQGRSRAGVDCAGLVIRLAADLQLPIQDYRAYGRLPRSDTLLRVMREQCIEWRGIRQPGLIALMRFEREPQHLAVIAEGTIIHALSTSRRVVEHRLDQLWAARIVGLFALPGVSYDS